MRWLAIPLLAVPAALLAACGDAPSERPQASREQLMDPQACRSCHEQHYAEWAQSMHAYASKDPVFLAQNRQAQEETNGELGDFCIQCHAPMAVRTGASRDGLNLEELPEALSGVTCYFCHASGEVSGAHNNAIELASDGVLRAGLREPASSSFHASGYSELLAGARAESSALCGACHDLVTPAEPLGHALEVERTFAEWSDSLFSPEHAARPEAALSCSACHMPGVERAAIAPGGPPRVRHLHLFPGVDVALTPFPTTGDATIDDAAANERAVRELLDTSLRVEVCVQRLPGAAFAIEVTLDNVNAGHSFPSGSSHNRDLWLEVRAFDREERALYESGVSYGEGSEQGDSDLWLLRDRLLDDAGAPTHALWKAAAIERFAIPASATSDRRDPGFYRNHRVRRFPAPLDASIAGEPARVSVTARLRPVGLAALDELVGAGYLSPSVKERLPTHDLIPNRHLADDEQLSSLAEVTFEWSQSVRDSGRFDAWLDATTPFVKDCLGMPSLRGPR